MAVYKLKKMPRGDWRVWARYTPYKGAPTQSFIASGPVGDLAANVEKVANQVAAARPTKKEGQGRAS